MPDRYGSKSTVYPGFSELQQKGIWKRILSELIKSAHRQEKISLQKISVDSSSIAAKKGGDKTGYDGFKKILGTKIHVAVDRTGLPISIRASPANVHDSTKFIDVLENISEPADDGLIREIISAYADRGYDAAYIRDYLGCHGITVAFHTKRTQGTLHKTGIKSIMARQGLS